jgi:hypothetical protein
MTATIASLIRQSSLLIAEFNPQLAKVWDSKPFSRVETAYAFARGFKGDDIHPAASAVIRAALMERDLRKEKYAAIEKL